MSNSTAVPTAIAPTTRLPTYSSLVAQCRSVARGPRARVVVAAAVLMAVLSGGVGFAMGRGARGAADVVVTALEDGSRGVVVQPQAGSLTAGSLQAGSLTANSRSDQPSVAADPPLGAAGHEQWASPPPPDARTVRPRAARLPTRRQTRRMTQTMERLGAHVMKGVELRVDSIGRSLQLPPPKFDQP